MIPAVRDRSKLCRRMHWLAITWTRQHTDSSSIVLSAQVARGGGYQGERITAGMAKYGEGGEVRRGGGDAKARHWLMAPLADGDDRPFWRAVAQCEAGQRTGSNINDAPCQRVDTGQPPMGNVKRASHDRQYLPSRITLLRRISRTHEG